MMAEDAAAEMRPTSSARQAIERLDQACMREASREVELGRVGLVSPDEVDEM